MDLFTVNPSLAISVVIPTYRLRNRVETTLRSLEMQTLNWSEFEVVVVDDGSDDGTRDVLEAWRPGFAYRLIRNDDNLGRSLSRNRGWREAKGAVIVFLDGDMIIHPRLLEIYHEQFATEQVDIVSGARRCINLSPEASTSSIAWEMLSAYVSAEDVSQYQTMEFSAIREYSQLGPTPSQLSLESELENICTNYPFALTRALAFITSNVAVRRSVLSQTRGFLPLLDRGEDTELGLQLAELGARFSYEPRAEAIHMFTGWTGTPESQQDTLEGILFRHPFTAVFLWFCWAQHPGSDPFPYLADIARAESNGALRKLNVEEIAKESGVKIPATFSIGRAALLAYWHSVSKIPHEQLGSFLDTAIGQGLLHTHHPEAGALFDVLLTNSWLNEHCEWRQHLYRNSFFSHHLTKRQRGDNNASVCSIRWQIDYSVEIPSSILAGEPTAAVNLPLPITTGCQQDLRFSGCTPPDLMAYSNGMMIVAYPLTIVNEQSINLRYSFSCLVHEFKCDLHQISADKDLGIWLRPISLSQRRVWLSLVNKVKQLSGVASVVERAKYIYSWLLENTEYRPNPAGGIATIKTGMGNCMQLSRVFVALCRVSGVPARERHGFLIDFHNPSSPSLAGESCSNFSPFMHTWAEFHCSTNGWIPVEVLPVGHGSRAISPWNFPDANLQSSMRHEQTLFDPYYFGGLDPFRIHGSSSPSVLLPNLIRHRGGRWEEIEDPELSIRHLIKAKGVPENLAFGQCN